MALINENKCLAIYGYLSLSLSLHSFCYFLSSLFLYLFPHFTPFLTILIFFYLACQYLSIFLSIVLKTKSLIIYAYIWCKFLRYKVWMKVYIRLMMIWATKYLELSFFTIFGVGQKNKLLPKLSQHKKSIYLLVYYIHILKLEFK